MEATTSQIGTLASVDPVSTPLGMTSPTHQIHSIEIVPPDVAPQAVVADGATWAFFVSLSLVVTLAFVVCFALLITRLRVAYAKRARRIAVEPSFAMANEADLSYAA